MIGKTLSHFEITAKLGEGGMGEVYRAIDTRLDRTVAIKVLPEHLVDDPQSRERFEREAKAVSSLNHPNICTLYDVGEHEGQRYLVMELVEGETLAARLKKGRLPFDQALEYAVEIADALDLAHRQGVVHRDLKPGNIMLTGAGAKLLDFGLARLGVESPVESSSQLQTFDATEPLTAQGAIVGTLQYMAPEQLEGKPADARTDIFAYGAVLYEMVTGQRAFQGENQASLIAAIMHQEPRPMSDLGVVSPPMLEHIVTICLAKQADDRWQSTADLVRQVRWVSEVDPASEAAPTAAPAASAVASRWRVLPWVLVIVALLAASLAWVNRRPSRPDLPQSSARLSVELPPHAPLAPSGSFFLGVGRPALALSRDGSWLAWVALVDEERELWLRDMRTGEVRALAGTQGAQGPFFSPDGEWLGFFAENELKKVRVTGGEPQRVANAVWGYGAEWGESHIYFAATESKALSRVLPSGGQIDRVTSLPAAWPALLPGGSQVLLTVGGVAGLSVFLEDLGQDSAPRELLPGTSARYVPTGHLVYGQEGRLLSVPFDLASGAVSGDSMVLADDLRTEAHGAIQATWSDDGTLVYAAGPDLSQGQLVWLRRDGERAALRLPPAGHSKFELSPDGTRLAIAIVDGSERDIWVHEIGRGSPQRLTRTGTASQPVWDISGESIYFTSGQEDGRGIHRVAVGGARSVPEEVVPVEAQLWAPIQHTEAGLFYGVSGNVNLVRESQEENVVETVLGESFQEGFPALSPDGRWLAYMSDESGHWQIYVVSYPDQRIKRLVSSTGGEEPRWNPDGSEIIYRYGSEWFSVSLSDDPKLTLGSPEVLFEGPFINMPGHSWDISPDGERFLLVENPAQGEPQTSLVVITNFFDEIERRAPVDP